MAFKVSSFTDNLVDTIHEESIKELNEFYWVDYSKNYIKIFTIEDRETYDKINWKKTENWMKWFAQWNNVYIFDIEVLENVTNWYHKKDIEKYGQTIKHEIAHCYFRNYSSWKSDKYPISRLNEWLSIYLSWQLKFKKPVNEFKEFLEFWDYWSKWVYAESWFVVKVLIDSFWKEKILLLINSIKNINSIEQIYENFERIYWFSLIYDNINKLIR